MSQSDRIIGIDLGTTNSEVAAFSGDGVKVLGPQASRILPSCVGFSPAGELLVGQAARNQHVVYPELTVRSIKRRMGLIGKEAEVRLGERTFTPQEISALILKELLRFARQDIGPDARRAVITVPAYFSDAARQATREAGEMAGLEVARILNEPTAASLAYGDAGSGAARRTVMVYDLGGGTFDVSLVVIEGEVIEVLASHGNNRLGGDDFDELLVGHLARAFRERHDLDPLAVPASRARLLLAAEEAKKKLSYEPFAMVREEALLVTEGKPLHLEVELSRDEYEDMIRPLVQSTLDSVSRALKDAGKSSRDLDGILLVGGSTRTPLVTAVLERHTGITPRQEVHPDLCVALGAGVLASRLEGREVDRVLVDVSPFSFGPAHLGVRGGFPYPYCYKPVIRRNTPLPVTRTERYFTASPYQTCVEVEIYQGEDEDALHNILVGQFRIDGLTAMEDSNEVLCRMSLDLDGILRVSAIEKLTGKSAHITIAHALEPKTDSELHASRARLESLFEGRDAAFEDGDLEDAGTDDDADHEDDLCGEAVTVDEGEAAPSWVRNERPSSPAAPGPDGSPLALAAEAGRLLERSAALLPKMHSEDREEAEGLRAAIEAAVSAGDGARLAPSVSALRELLFFIEGR